MFTCCGWQSVEVLMKDIIFLAVRGLDILFIPTLVQCFRVLAKGLPWFQGSGVQGQRRVLEPLSRATSKN